MNTSYYSPIVEEFLEKLSLIPQQFGPKTNINDYMLIICKSMINIIDEIIFKLPYTKKATWWTSQPNSQPKSDLIGEDLRDLQKYIREYMGYSSINTMTRILQTIGNINYELAINDQPEYRIIFNKMESIFSTLNNIMEGRSFHSSSSNSSSSSNINNNNNMNLYTDDEDNVSF